MHGKYYSSACQSDGAHVHVDPAKSMEQIYVIDFLAHDQAPGRIKQSHLDADW